MTVVPAILDLDQTRQDVAAPDLLADLQREHLGAVGARIAQAIDRGNGGHYDHVAPLHQGGRGPKPQSIDVLVDRRVLFDVRIRRRHVRFGLVVVVVGDEVLDRVSRKELLQFTVQLGGEGLVVAHHQGREACLLNHARHGDRLPAPRDALALAHALGQRPDGFRLVAGRLERKLESETIWCHDISSMGPWPAASPPRPGPLDWTRRADHVAASLPLVQGAAPEADMTRHMRIPIALTVLLTTVISCSDSARQEELAELRSQRRSLLMQFSSVQNVIRGVQTQALEEPAVRAAQDRFNAELRAAVLRDDPEAADLLDRARAVGHDLQDMATPQLLQHGEEDPRPVTAEERADVAAELAEVERSLRPVIDRAFQDPAVVQAFATLRDSVVAAMLRIDPGAQRSIDLMAELEAQVAEIDAEILRLSE
jgi:hypothetical protein